jgi:TRAP-type C4-dicarboxylate transport system substrate-binding protein
MKKGIVTLIIVFALGFITCFSCGTGNAAGVKSVDFIISSTVSDIDYANRSFFAFKEYMDKNSGGLFKTTIYTNAQLAKSDMENMALVADKSVQMCFAASGSLASMANMKAYNIYDYPYLFQTVEDVYKISDGELGQQLNQEFLKKTGLRIVANFVWGFMGVANNSKEVVVPTDLKGQKIRCLPSEGYSAYLTKCEATPINMGIGELLPSLQQGIVDGCTTCPTVYMNNGLYEMVKYYTDTKWSLTEEYIVINDAWYQALSPEHKKFLDEALAYYQKTVRQTMIDGEIETRRELAKHLKYRDLTPEEMNIWVTALSPILDARPDIAGKEFVAKARTILGR